MELLFEIILDLIFEGSIEIIKSRKVSKWIRYPLIAILSIFIMAVIGLLGFVGITMIVSKDIYAVLGGLLFILFDIILIVSGILTTKKEIKLRKLEEK